MNDYITINDNNISLDRTIAINTSKLITYIKNNLAIDILEDKNVKNVKRYIEHNTIEFTFYYKDDMYIATYLINLNEYEINKVV